MVKCSNCTSTNFKVEEVSPRDSNFKIMLVACITCNTVVGPMDYFNIGTLVKKLEAKIDSLENDVRSVNSNLGTINNNISTVIKLLKK